MNIVRGHEDYIGKIAKLTKFGVELEKEYEELFNIGNYGMAQFINYYCYLGGRYELSLMFIDEAPIHRNGIELFCLKEIGNGVMGDWHWYTLNQLIVCE